MFPELGHQTCAGLNEACLFKYTPYLLCVSKSKIRRRRWQFRIRFAVLLNCVEYYPESLSRIGCRPHREREITSAPQDPVTLRKRLLWMGQMINAEADYDRVESIVIER